jgi:hypothetical protein
MPGTRMSRPLPVSVRWALSLVLLAVGAGPLLTIPLACLALRLASLEPQRHRILLVAVHALQARAGGRIRTARAVGFPLYFAPVLSGQATDSCCRLSDLISR